MSDLEAEVRRLSREVTSLHRRNGIQFAAVILLLGVLCLGCVQKGGLEVESVKVIGRDGKVKANIFADDFGNGCVELSDRFGTKAAILGRDVDLAAEGANSVGYSLRFTDRLNIQRI